MEYKYKNMIKKTISKIRKYLKNISAPRSVKYVKNKNLTYLDRNALIDIHDRVVEIEKKEVNGVIVEAGCALGGSAIVMSDAKKPSRHLKLYDVFDKIPAPGDKDGDDVHERYETIKKGKAKGLGDDKYYGYKENLVEEVKMNFKKSGNRIEKNNIYINKGLFEENLFVSEEVALAHIDCDWYDSVMICLERIAPKMANGAYIIVDDYNHWSGCRKAVDDYFEDKREKFSFIKKSRLHIKKHIS